MTSNMTPIAQTSPPIVPHRPLSDIMSLADLKRYAKEVKRIHKVPYSTALELVAGWLGFPYYDTARRYLFDHP